MISASIGVTGASVRLLPDGTYLDSVAHGIRTAVRRVLCSVFIVDLHPGRDKDLLVDTMVIELQAARWRGADVRLLIGGSRTNADIAQLAVAARSRAKALGIPSRALMAAPVRGSHVKLVIADDTAFIGSHNWSVGAFTNQSQDSVAVISDALSAFLADRFEEQWQRAGEHDV